MRKLTLIAIAAAAIFAGASSPAPTEPSAKPSSDVLVAKAQPGGRGLSGVDAL